ncbi:UNVERIFIED_CONTAM: Transcription initiation factor TFIID subunitb, partial [Sesamum radiatum]
MDPNIVKFLEEDEHDSVRVSQDETMHSGADVDAFTAELNRDIERNDSTPQQPSDSDNDNRLSDAGAQPQDDRNTFPVSQPIGSLTSGEQSIHIQEPVREPNPDSQIHTLQNISNRPSVAMGSNDQLPMSMELNDQQSISSGKVNQPTTSMGISNEQQVMSTVNQHTTGMGSQQATTSGMSNQQPMTSSNQQPGTALKLNKQVPFGMLLPIIQPQLDKDRAMQLHTLYFKLKKNEISKDGFVRHMRSIVGDQMLKMAVYKLQTQKPLSTSLTKFTFLLFPAQMPIDLSNSTSDSNTAKPREVESQADSQGVQVSQMSTSSSGVLSQERKHPAFPTQGLNKQQHMHFSQTSFPTYGSAGSSYSPFSATNAASSTSLRPQPHDSQMKQAPAHQNMTVSHVGSSTQAMNMMNVSKFDRPHSFADPKKIQGGSLTHVNSNTALQQNQVQWPSSTSKEPKIGVSSSMTHVKQEPPDQSNEQQHKGLSSLSSTPVKHGPASGSLKDESFEIQSSRPGFTPPTSLAPTNSVSSSIPSAMETNILSNSRMPSLTSPIGTGNNSKAPLKKPLVGQKKPMEAPGSSPPSSKKQKVSGAFLDQSIEQLNDVTAVSGVNLREEEEQLFSGSKEDSRVSEASRRVVQEEEERLILQKIPLQKKVVEIMAKCGLKNMSNDVERCLSLRVDIEKPRHRTIITSDVRQQIMTINRKAREEWEKKQAETEKSQKLNDPESTAGVDGDKEKDESRAKSTKANKEEDDKMRTTAANVAVRAATGVGDMLSRWQLMIEAKQKQGGSDTASGSQAGKDAARKPSATSSKNTRENQEAEKRDTSAAFTTP